MLATFANFYETVTASLCQMQWSLWKLVNTIQF